MINTTFTDFRKNATAYFNKVEMGETVIVSRHGKPIAEIIPASQDERELSWKKPGLKLSVKGISLSNEIIKERELGR